MAKKAAKATADKPAGGSKKGSRTLYMSDDDWQRLSALSDRQKRGRTAQIMHMVDEAEARGE